MYNINPEWIVSLTKFRNFIGAIEESKGNSRLCERLMGPEWKNRHGRNSNPGVSGPDRQKNKPAKLAYS
jgi:hypothetical protein